MMKLVSLGHSAGNKFLRSPADNVYLIQSSAVELIVTRLYLR